MTEAELTKNIVKALNDLPGTWAVKIHGGPHQSSGLPDVVGLRFGRFFGLEVKLPGKERTLTERQAYKLRKIKEAKGVSAVVISVEQAVKSVRHGRQE